MPPEMPRNPRTPWDPIPMSETQNNELSERVIRVVDGRPRGAYARVYRDVLLSPEFVGKVTHTIDPQTGKKTRHKTKPISLGAVLLYCYLGSYTSGYGGTCTKAWHLSIKRMASDLNLSRNSIYRAIDDLKSRRLLEVHGEKGSPLWYRLMDPLSVVDQCATHQAPSFPQVGKKPKREVIPNLGSGDPKPDTPVRAEVIPNLGQPDPKFGTRSSTYNRQGSENLSRQSPRGGPSPVDIPNRGSQVGNEPHAMRGQQPVPLERVTSSDWASLRDRLAGKVSS